MSSTTTTAQNNAAAAEQSSDDVRSARPLAHARHADVGPVQLELGEHMATVSVAYETWGALDAAASNAVLVCHALSGDSHAARHVSDDDAGWWDSLVGPGRPVDTRRFFVVCCNCLGGCRGTTGPASIDPRTGKPYGSQFPTVTMGDIVETQSRVVFGVLGVRRLRAVVGGSMGGMQAMLWATRFADLVDNAVILASCARLSTQSLAWDVIGRNCIIGDPLFSAGDFYADEGRGPATGLALARMLAHVTYLCPQAMEAKFGATRNAPRKVDARTPCETRFSVGSYLAHQGTKFVERFDANTYLSVSLAIDLFDLGETREQLAKALGRPSSTPSSPPAAASPTAASSRPRATTPSCSTTSSRSTAAS
eukprot:m51a1_g1420 putative homoserine o-acetyltransferase (366) ;mRNA; r:55762-57291